MEYDITHDIVQSARLAAHPGLIHGFTTRQLGDMRAPAPRDLVFASQGIASEFVVLCEQVHGNQVTVVGKQHRGQRLPGADALVYKKEDPEAPVGLAVRVADCVPLLFIDDHAHVIGAAHAGWRGTAANIAQATTHAMQRAGASPDAMQVVIGPHIGACCYTVDAARAEEFLSRFGADSGVVARKESAYTLDIGAANRLQLIEAGVPEDRIELVDICTSCSVDRMFSYRKDTKESFGEILGFIGWKTI